MKLLRKAKKSAFKGKTVLLRIDLNVEPGAPLDSYRLEAVLPTIRFLRARGARVVMMSHRGNPEAKSMGQTANRKALSLRPFTALLLKKLREKVVFVDDADLKEAKRKITASKESFFLLENLRFWEGERKNSAQFSKRLAVLGDAYVNDAFAESHRKVASITGIPKYLPSYAGLRLEEEVKRLGGVMKKPLHPVTLVVGGAKIADKVGVIEYFWKRADAVLMGGGPANTFFAAEGVPMGDSLVDVSAFPFVKEYRDKGKIMLPVDSEVHAAKGSERILDIGEVTARWFGDIVEDSKTVIWNGPMGFFEKKGFEKGTIAVWKAILALAKKNPRARIVVGGGETIASLQLLKANNYKLKTSNLFLSTGGGAMLEFLSGEKLPGIEALKR